jgi:prolipoprotein diacylglyceryltransferase
VFQRLGESFARHPAQLYEAISCFILFAILYRTYNKYRAALPAGRNFGMFITVLFTLRFFYEFLKENQVGFEDTLFLNMGQILSIPLIIIGAYVWMRSYKNGELSKA